MPLTDLHKNLLYEIYEVPIGDQTVFTRGLGTASVQSSFDYQVGVKDMLLKAFDLIDADETRVTRVGSLLAEYEELATDRSLIERNGYSLRPGSNIRAIKDALYPYTGIRFRHGKNNRYCQG